MFFVEKNYGLCYVLFQVLIGHAPLVYFNVRQRTLSAFPIAGIVTTQSIVQITLMKNAVSKHEIVLM